MSEFSGKGNIDKVDPSVVPNLDGGNVPIDGPARRGAGIDQEGSDEFFD
ncbi:MAG: hypothetical protein VYE18_03020 [Pseudomonadota bacterium]|nr:hypothetical protein [Pseudomonadota bacterium]